MCNIEGAEREILNPESAPTLQGIDIIVVSHECLSSGITQSLIDRFKGTHQITLVRHQQTQATLKSSRKCSHGLLQTGSYCG